MKLQTILSGAMLGANMFLGFGVATMLVWLLGASGYGIYSYVYVLFAMISVVIQLGIPRLAVRETAGANATGNWPLMRAFWRWAGRAILAFSVIVMLGSILFAWLFVDNDTLVILGALTVPFATFAALRGGILRGLGFVVLSQLPETLLRNLFFAAVLAVLVLTGIALSPTQTMGINLAATALAFGIGAWFLFLKIPAQLNSGTEMTSIPSTQWWKAAAFMGVSVGMNQITSYADLLILQLYRPDEDLGIYRIIYQMSMFVAFGVQAVTLVFSPRFANAHARQDHKGLQHLVTFSVRIGFAAALPISAFLITFGNTFLVLVYGDIFASGYGPLIVLVAAQLGIACFGSIGTLMNMTNNESYLTKALAFSAVSNIVLNFALIPTYGLYGAAIATFASLVGGNFIVCFLAYRQLGISSHILAFAKN